MSGGEHGEAPPYPCARCSWVCVRSCCCPAVVSGGTACLYTRGSGDSSCALRWWPVCRSSPTVPVGKKKTGL